MKMNKIEMQKYLNERINNNHLFQVFGGGIYLKNNAKLETGITCSSAIGGASNFAIGCKYALDKDAAVRAKVDTKSQVKFCSL